MAELRRAIISRDRRPCGLSGSSECRARRSTTGSERSFEDRVHASDVSFMGCTRSLAQLALRRTYYPGTDRLQELGLSEALEETRQDPCLEQMQATLLVTQGL